MDELSSIGKPEWFEGQAKTADFERGRVGSMLREHAAKRNAILEDNRYSEAHKLETLGVADSRFGELIESTGARQALEKLEDHLEAQAAFFEPETQLARTEFQDGSRELAFLQRASRFSGDQLIAAAEIAKADGNVARLRALTEEARSRDGISPQHRETVESIALDAVKGSPGILAFERAKTAARDLHNSLCFVDRDRKAVDVDVENMPPAQYAELRKAGIL